MIFFHVVSCRVYVWDAWCIEIHCLENGNTTSFSAVSAMAWTEQSTLFHVGLGFCVGFAGAQSIVYLMFATLQEK